MFKVKKILNLIALVIGGLVVAYLPTCFSIAQEYWSIESLLGTNPLEFIMPRQNVWLYAVTEPNTYTIHFDGNGGLGTMDNMYMKYDSGANLLENSFTKDGWSFKGWSTSQLGAVEYGDKEYVNIVTENGADVTLYAQRGFEASYTINYYQENITGTGYDVIIDGVPYDLVGTGIEYTASDSIVVLEGEEFTGFTLQTGEVVSINPDGSTIVPYYYNRNTYNLIVKDRGEELINTGIKFGVNIVLPDDPTGWTGNTFSGWYSGDELYTSESTMPAGDLEIVGVWTYGEHSITFDTDGGDEIATITGNYGDPVLPPDNPTKDGYEFVRWEPEIPDTIPYDDIVIRAIWREITEDHGSGWSGGGGRKRGTPDTSEGEQQHGSATDYSQPGNVIRDKKIDLEVFFAYMWAHDMGIIDESWQNSDPDGYVTRGAMAEMVVRFTEKVLEKKIPATPERCVWGDTEREWKSLQARIYAEKACALGVMGIRMENFMPNKILDRAEFGTILSRILWGDKYDIVDATSTKPYYTKHLSALSERKIMTAIDDPESKRELRKWAWLMLMRARIEKEQQKKS